MKQELNIIDSKYGWQNVKLAMLVRDFSCNGGLELYTYQLVSGLLKEGLKITVICETSQTDFTHNNLQIIKIKPSKPKSSKVDRITHYTKEFSQAITKYGPFDLVHSQHVGAHNIDVVTFHNHTVSRLNKCGTPFEATLNKIKLLFRPDYILQDEIDLMLTKEARVLVFPSRICKQDFIEYFHFNETKNMSSLTVAYPGWQLASCKSSTPEENNSLPTLINADFPREKTIIFVGRGYRKKGLDVLLNACLLLKQQNHSFRLLIAGLKEKFLDRWQLNTFGLSKNVTYLGFVQNMEEVYKAGAIIALPSRVEPFGMSALQAMSYGLVPVVSKVAGVSELLQPDIDGLILENHLDANELAHKLGLLLNDTEKTNAMATNAQAKAQTVSWQNTVNSTLSAYRNIFQRKYVV